LNSQGIKHAAFFCFENRELIGGGRLIFLEKEREQICGNEVPNGFLGTANPSKICHVGSITLANSLTAEEREEFDLQYSPAALSLRDSLSGIELTSEEFRSLYEVRQKFDAALEAGMQNPDAVDPRSFEEETERILGPERFAHFQGEIRIDDSSAPE
jgi:hypothetical protein